MIIVNFALFVFHRKVSKYCLVARCLRMFVSAALPTNVSCTASLTMAVVLLAMQQIFRHNFAGNQYMTIAGGFVGSLIFMFLLTVSLF